MKTALTMAAAMAATILFTGCETTQTVKMHNPKSSIEVSVKGSPIGTVNMNVVMDDDKGTATLGRDKSILGNVATGVIGYFAGKRL